MAPRRLDGWEPRTITEFVRDDAGVVVQEIVYREPEFDEHQVSLMLAYARHKADVGSHGQLMSEATNPKADLNNYDGGYRYVAGPPITDHAEKAHADSVEAWRKTAGENANMNGLIFPVRKVVDG